jgi:hypothetical protein
VSGIAAGGGGGGGGPGAGGTIAQLRPHASEHGYFDGQRYYEYADERYDNGTCAPLCDDGTVRAVPPLQAGDDSGSSFQPDGTFSFAASLPIEITAEAGGLYLPVLGAPRAQLPDGEIPAWNASSSSSSSSSSSTPGGGRHARAVSGAAAAALAARVAPDAPFLALNGSFVVPLADAAHAVAVSVAPRNGSRGHVVVELHAASVVLATDTAREVCGIAAPRRDAGAAAHAGARDWRAATRWWRTCALTEAQVTAQLAAAATSNVTMAPQRAGGAARPWIGFPDVDGNRSQTVLPLWPDGPSAVLGAPLVTGGIAAVVRREDPAIATGLDGSASSGHAPHVSITTGSRHVTVSRDRTIATVHMARSAAPGEPDADREARLAAEQDRGEVLVAVVRSTATGQVVALYEIRVLSRAGRATGCASPGTSVSVGKRVTCATLPAEGGAVACWGMLQANAVGWFNVSITPTPHNGYIGDETGEAGDAIGRVPFAAWGAAPFVIPSAHFGGGGAIAQAWSHAVSVALGEGWGMALFANGGVRRWGDNTKGQLLTGDANPLADPVAVATAGYMPFGPAGREAFEVRAISAGTLHGCALFSSGAVRCFGFGSSGRTGANAVTDTDTITASELPVVDLGTNTYAIGEISCGAVYTCVVTAATRRPICFGTGSSKRTGRASISNTGDGIGVATSDLAELVVGTGDPECLQINTGAQHACCVVGPRGAAAAGLLGTAAFPRSVRCWGDGGSGGTGRGSTTDVDASLAIDVPMARAGSAQPIQVACGSSHTLIAFTDGTVRGFGVRLYGRTFAGSASISGTIGDDPGDTDAIEAAAGITDVIASVSGPESLMSCLVHADGAIRCGGRDQGAGFAMTGR